MRYESEDNVVVVVEVRHICAKPSSEIVKRMCYANIPRVNGIPNYKYKYNTRVCVLHKSTHYALSSFVKSKSCTRCTKNPVLYYKSLERRRMTFRRK